MLTCANAQTRTVSHFTVTEPRDRSWRMTRTAADERTPGVYVGLCRIREPTPNPKAHKAI